MDMASKHVFEVLSEKNVTELHHANSVATACHFIRARSLLSRGTVDRLGLAQTRQSSDDSDKRYGVWFDVFLDSVDIHHRANRANVYGPVLFVFDIDLINRNSTGRIWVTKTNPSTWAGRAQNDRWFQGQQDLQQNFVRGRFEQMVVLRHCGGALPFGRHLRRIVLDDPRQQDDDGIDFYSLAMGALRLSMRDARIDVRIERRECRRRCTCEAYWAEGDRLHSMFDPHPTIE